MTTIKAFFSHKLGHFFPIFEKGQGRHQVLQRWSFTKNIPSPLPPPETSRIYLTPLPLGRDVIYGWPPDRFGSVEYTAFYLTHKYFVYHLESVAELWEENLILFRSNRTGQQIQYGNQCHVS